MLAADSVGMRLTLTTYGLTAMVAKGFAYDHPLYPAFP